MPVYVYRVVTPGSGTGSDETFEVRQSIHDPPLTRHPQTGEPVERIILPPMIGCGNLGDSQINNAGFTKYVKNADGGYDPM